MLLRLFLTDLKMLTRNRQALFWAFMFPLMFTFIFGFFFGKNTSAGNLALINRSDSELSAQLVAVLEKSDLFKIQKEDNLETAKDEIKKNQISAIVYIPENFGAPIPDAPTTVTIYADQGNAQVNSVITGLMNKFLTEINYQVQKAKPIYTLTQENVSDRKLSYFDFVLAGILGLSLMNSSVIGIAVGMSKYREDKILKRITTTPLPIWIFIVAEVASRLVLNFVQISTILLIGKYFFDAHIYGNIFAVYGLALVGGILFQLLGFVIASLSKTTDAAQGMATAVTIPMMFLAGVFFPIDSLPRWLYSIVQYLPLAPLLRMIRTTTLEGLSPLDNPINAVIVIAWIIFCLVFSIFKFKLSDE